MSVSPTLDSQMTSTYERIYALVRRIPRGKVATYGQIAELADVGPRQVGYALHHLPERSNVPWHRVVNSRGEISPRSAGDSHELQRHLLAAEGVELNASGRIDLREFRWSAALKSRAPGRR